MSARCFTRQRGRRIRRPTAQSGRRSSARGAALPALCLLCSGRLDSPYTKAVILCTASVGNPVPYKKLAILCTGPFGNPVSYTKSVILCTAPFRNSVSYTDRAVWCTAIKIMMRTARKRVLILAVGGGFVVAARKRGLILAV